MSNNESIVEPSRQKTGGRSKGTPNLVTAELKNLILGALSDVGGQAYLARQAEENPVAFMGLVGKILPKDINANVETKNVTIVLDSYDERI